MLSTGTSSTRASSSSSKVRFSTLLRSIPQTVLTSSLLLIGFNAFTLVPPDNVSPRRTIQIVATINQSVFDALAWFDLDCCAVGYTGDSVVAVPRAVRSLSLGKWIGGVNFFDPKLGRKGVSRLRRRLSPFQAWSSREVNGLTLLSARRIPRAARLARAPASTCSAASRSLCQPRRSTLSVMSV